MGVKMASEDGERFAHRYGLQNYMRGPRAAKGWTWLYDADECRKVGAVRADTAARLLNAQESNGVKPKTYGTQFVASQSVLDALAQINSKIDRLCSMWDAKEIV